MAWRTLEQRLADTELKANRLRSQFKQDARRRDSRKKIVIAGAMLAEAREVAGFERQMKGIARRRVTRPSDLEAIAEWLATT
jgi:hypothetical protein